MELNKLTNTKGKFDGKQLGNISGLYKVNQTKKEYKYVSKGFNTNYKKPFSIRLADNEKYVFVNHSDYSVWTANLSIKNDSYKFEYNNETYSIPINYNFNESINDKVVYITKENN